MSFVRDVEPILNKVGCTQGTCHGAAKGKNGFKLSLRGYDPEYDYRSLINDLSGRRFNRTEPAQSLMLLKPTAQVPHGGGLRLEPGSAYYNTMLQWITEGTEFGDPVSATVTKLEVTPPEILLPKPGPKQQLTVTARYADGSTREVTKEAIYSSNTPTIAEVDDAGVVNVRAQGRSRHAGALRRQARRHQRHRRHRKGRLHVARLHREQLHR